MCKLDRCRLTILPSFLTLLLRSFLIFCNLKQFLMALVHAFIYLASFDDCCRDLWLFNLDFQKRKNNNKSTKSGYSSELTKKGILKFTNFYFKFKCKFCKNNVIMSLLKNLNYFTERRNISLSYWLFLTYFMNKQQINIFFYFFFHSNWFEFL